MFVFSTIIVGDSGGTSNVTAPLPLPDSLQHYLYLDAANGQRLPWSSRIRHSRNAIERIIRLFSSSYPRRFRRSSKSSTRVKERRTKFPFRCVKRTAFSMHLKRLLCLFKHLEMSNGSRGHAKDASHGSCSFILASTHPVYPENEWFDTSHLLQRICQTLFCMTRCAASIV